MVGLSERFDLDRRAVQRIARLRDKYGAGPLLIPFPGRSLALILDPAHLHRVLAQTPEPFATASMEKRAALAHFEPKNAVISEGPERAERRRFNEDALHADRPVHRLAEAARLRADARLRGELAWKEFSQAWFRVVRRIVFGESAREDHAITDLMAQLRSAANWAFQRPQRPRLREQLLDRIRGYLARAEPDSLAGLISTMHTGAETAPEHQVPQWLFAFDPAGMTTFRSLALLASSPEHARIARDEAATRARQDLPFLRSTVLESLRLWPTTPLILRQTTIPTTWETGDLPANTAIVIFVRSFIATSALPSLTAIARNSG